MDAEGIWLERLLLTVERGGPIARSAAGYIHQHGVRLGFHEQKTGARWRPGQRIDLHPRYLSGSPQDVYSISLVIHEVLHLQQGPLAALSVYGELAAWQLQFTFVRDRIGRFQEDPQKDSVMAEIMALPLGWDRNVLGAARRLMRRFAGPSYRINLLPLYPLQHEIAWTLFHTKPKVQPDANRTIICT